MRSRCLPAFPLLFMASVGFAAVAPAGGLGEQMEEITRRDAYDVHVRVAGSEAGSQRVWSWTTCAGNVAEAGGRSDVDTAAPASGRFAAREGRLDVEVDLPGAAGAQRFAAKAVAVPSDDAVLARGSGAGEPARVAIRRAAPRVSIQVTDVPAREIAQRLARVAGIRIEAGERLSEEPITLKFQCVEPWTVVMILADVSGVTPLRAGRDRFSFSTASEHGELTSLHAAWESARDGGDPEAAAEALQPLLAKLEAADGSFVVGDASLWGEAARLANQREQLAEGERALRAQLAQLERLNGDRDGVEYGETLFRLGQQRHMQDDEAAAAALYDQAIATLERALGPVHPTLAKVQARRGALHFLAGEHEAAIPLLQRAVASFGEIAADGVGAYAALTALEALGYSLQSRRRYDDARPMFERFLALANVVDGEDSDTSARALEALADLEITSDRLVLAKPLLQRLATMAAASTRLKESARERLAAIELLGPFADAGLAIDDARLLALRQRLAASGPGPVADEARRMLERRVARFLWAGDQKAQHQACRLAAEVEAARAGAADAPRLALIRDELFADCMRRPMAPP